MCVCVCSKGPILKYSTNEDVLVIGDGDLTFGCALSRKFGKFETRVSRKNNINANRLHVSCYETVFQFLNLYKSGSEVIYELRKRGKIPVPYWKLMPLILQKN